MTTTKTRGEYLDKLEALMEARGVTVEAVAAACEHRVETVSRWFEGQGRGFNLGDFLAIHRDLFSDMTMPDFMQQVIPGDSRSDA